MGYTTRFEGRFTLLPALTPAHRDELVAFSQVSHHGVEGAPRSGWCDWAPSDDGGWLGWTGAEKFYDYVEWLEYLLAHFLVPWGYRLGGQVRWKGEEYEDQGIIHAHGDRVETIAEDVPAYDPIAHAREQLGAPDWKHRLSAAKLLIAERQIDDAIRALDDPEPRVRKTVANLLGDLGAPARAALPALTRLREDADEGVRKWATYAVGKLR